MKRVIKKQGGLTIIEFTLIAYGLFVLMFFAFEIGRYMFSMQMLNEMTRKAARLATVCSVEDQGDITGLAEVVENRPLGFEPNHLIVQYMDVSGVAVDTTGYSGLSNDEKDDVLAQIRFVSAEVSGYQFRFFPLLSFIGDAGAVNVPSFRTVLPAESLGIVRPNTGSENGVTENC